MHRLIKKYFIDKMYNEVELNINELSVFEKGDTLYSIYNMQERNLTVNQFNNIQKQVYEGLRDAGVYKNDHVIFICSGDDAYIGEMITGMNRDEDIHQVVSIVDTSRGMVMLEQGADSRWEALCIDISNHLKVMVGIIEQKIAEAEEETRSQMTTMQEIKAGLKYSAVWLCIVNVLIFLAMTIAGMDKYEQIVENYADNWIRVVNYGEWYRVLTATFLHGDMEHLLGNMLSLCAIGIYLEKVIGRKRFLITYFLSGIIASLASLGYNMYLNEDINSIGASGAIYGLCGMYIMVLIAFRDVFGKGNAIRLVIYIVLVGSSSMTNTSIDHMAHIGGLLAGVVIGIVSVWLPSMINTHKQVDRYED